MARRMIDRHHATALRLGHARIHPDDPTIGQAAQITGQARADFAYLLGADRPDHTSSPDVKMAVTTRVEAQLSAERDDSIDVFSLPADEKKAYKAAIKARRAELVAEYTAELVAVRNAAFDAKITALTASTDDLTKETASALIDALKG